MSFHRLLTELILVCIEDFPEYERNGFIILKDFFSDDDFEIISQISIFAEKSESVLHVKDLNSKEKRSTLGFHFEDYFSSKLKFMEKINILVSRVIGEAYIHQSRINYKRGKTANGWFPHSDFETWHAQDGMPRMMCLSAMIPITENRIENGCLYVAPGTHTVFFSAKKEKRASHESNFVNQSEGVPTGEDIEDLHFFIPEAKTLFLLSATLEISYYSIVIYFTRLMKILAEKKEKICFSFLIQ